MVVISHWRYWQLCFLWHCNCNNFVLFRHFARSFSKDHFARSFTMFVLDKISRLGLIVFSFTIGNFYCWTNFLGLFIFFYILNLAFKRRKMLKLKFFLQIVNVVNGY